MGSFEEHIKYALLIHAILTVTTLLFVGIGQVTIEYLVYTFMFTPITLIGALYPDIDHHSSKPNQLFKIGIYTFTLLLTMFFYTEYVYERLTDIFAPYLASTGGATLISLALGMSISMSLGYGLTEGFSRIRPKHRGFTHRFIPTTGLSLLLGLFVSQLSFLVGAKTPVVIGTLTTFFFMLGFISHLFCDGIVFNKETYTTIR